MSRFNGENTELAKKIIARYPRPRSALIPLCHLAQEQEGWLSEDAMAHIAELIDCTPAQVLGTASFYEMFKFHPVGKYCVNVCTNISCQLLGGQELLEHAEETLGVRCGGTTADGVFTLEDVECVAACTEAPAVQVNYRYFHRLDTDSFDELITALRSGDLDDSVPPHGTLARIRQDLEPDDLANVTPPEDQDKPVGIARAEAEAVAAESTAGDSGPTATGEGS
jgi:NADH-quinone oxidoreductase subunit E